MNRGPGGGGGRTRLGTKVVLNVYDLVPANEVLYPVGLGFHHSGVEILGSEYSFASGAGIFDSAPKEAPGARFRETIDMGVFDGGQAELKMALADLREEFSGEEYNLIRKNCNHFANALCWRLLRKRIPGYVNRLADVGVCCSCLLPRQMIENAPVGGDNNSSSEMSGFLVKAGNRGASTKISATAFAGQGNRLGSNSRTSPLRKEDELTDRREKARKAALARLQQSQASDQSS